MGRWDLDDTDAGRAAARAPAADPEATQAAPLRPADAGRRPAPG